jgi:DNA topoisomerase IA
MGRLGEAFDLGRCSKLKESGLGRAATYQVHAPTTKPKPYTSLARARGITATDAGTYR